MLAGVCDYPSSAQDNSSSSAADTRRRHQAFTKHDRKHKVWIDYTSLCKGFARVYFVLDLRNVYRTLAIRPDVTRHPTGTYFETY